MEWEREREKEREKVRDRQRCMHRGVQEVKIVVTNLANIRGLILPVQPEVAQPRHPMREGWSPVNGQSVP